MSSPAEEIAADYRAALEDLFTNTAAQIGTLTAVAKDNIEHAQAISAALTAHIKKVSTLPGGRSVCNTNIL